MKTVVFTVLFSTGKWIGTCAGAVKSHDDGKNLYKLYTIFASTHGETIQKQNCMEQNGILNQWTVLYHYDSCAHSIIESLYDHIMKTEWQLLLIHYCRSFESCTDLLVSSLLPPQVARANFNEDPYVQDFGISIDQKMVTVTGRILPPPLLQYGGKVGKHVR